MKLFKVDVRFKRKKRGRYGCEAIVHAPSRAAAEKFIAGKYVGSTIERTIALDSSTPKHFVIADLVDDESDGGYFVVGQRGQEILEQVLRTAAATREPGPRKKKT